MGFRGSRLFLIVALASLPPVVGTGLALAGSETSIQCVPSSNSDSIPNRKVGQAMAVRLQVSNDSCAAGLDYGKIAVGIIGNGGDTLANLGIFGPFKRPQSGTAPVASCTPMGECSDPPVNMYDPCSFDSDCDDVGGDGVCDVYYSQVDTPGVATEIVHVTDAMPASLAGTVATVVLSADLDDGDGSPTETIARCKVNVVP